MKQKLHLHVGYHKTGTTSFQKHLSRCELTFNYIGRRYDGSSEDRLILSLARAVALNDIEGIEKNTSEVLSLIKKNGHKQNLVSHENFLRPSERTFNGLNLFLDLLQKDVDVTVFVSTRPLEALVLSRFKHDLGRIRGWRRVQSFVPSFIYKLLIRNAIRENGECLYPYCGENTIKCSCGYFKKIPIDFYDLNRLKEKLDYPFNTCNLFSPSDAASIELVFGNSQLFPLPKQNVTKFKDTGRRANEMKNEINSMVAKVKQYG